MLRCFIAIAVVVVFATPACTARYSVTANYTGPSFFDNFNFYSAADPTHGYVYYTTQQQAFDWGLVNTSSSGAFIGCDSWSISSGSGRASVRLESKSTWNEGLFVMSLSHMPQGCGTWPAWWMVLLMIDQWHNHQHQAVLTRTDCMMNSCTGWSQLARWWRD
jgi:hypothetical protein